MIRAALTLEPGQIHIDKHNQVRLVVSVMSHLVRYKLLRHGTGGQKVKGLNVGETRLTSLANFREWVYGRNRSKLQ